MRRLSSFFFLYRGATPIDRSGVLTTPVRSKSLFPLPKMRSFTKTYEELCNQRAKELLTRADKLDVPAYVFWSGGIDSTCLLISLLKCATKAQKERITVLLSEGSIAEYPAFYEKHIRGQLRRDSAVMFPYLLGTKNLLINGEHNDQLFGSDIIAAAVNRFGQEAIQAPYNRELFQTFFGENLQGDNDTANAFVRLFERLCANAPIKLPTNYDRFWWINFVLKWQFVFMRMLSFTPKRNAHLLSANYLKTYYAPFYNTEEFQLWSMNNRTQRMKDSWRSYKWPAKEVIQRFTGDENYFNNKLKRGSLQFLVRQHFSFNVIDGDFKFHLDVSPEDFYQEANDFV